MDAKRSSARLTPASLDIQRANGHGYFDNPDTPLLIGDSRNNAHVRELERELSNISQELAGSIRREMELEDELDRVRGDIAILHPSELEGRRGSDYFSDSGTGSTKFPVTDVDAKLEQMDKQVRKVEQEKANFKLEMASKLQTELNRRRDLEELVRDLEDQVEKAAGTPSTRAEDLAATLDETKRRLEQEKTTKESFEDLYSATREELERYRNEAENLRNEVVPQLKAKLEGLEAEASDTQAIIYENTRLQQEINALKEGANHTPFSSIAEERVANAGRMSLQRSGSLARSGSLRRGNSVQAKDRADASRQRASSIGLSYTDGMKEIEEQRDALHKALKLLLKRYEKQRKEHERAIKKLAMEKALAEAVAPKRTAYTKEVAFLKEEVSTLRKRTEDALEQKWQYEKNLSGLKMDLDRAEQETRGLRIMMWDRDDVSAPSSQCGDEEDEQLKLSISRAENERDHARQVAADYRQLAEESNDESSEELIACANRMDELAEELQRQVETNRKLRERLATALAQGEREQQESTRQIEDMQKRLAGMEDSVLAAQQHSETTLANHDADIKRIEDAQSPALQRLKVATSEPGRLSPSTPLLRNSPRLGNKKLSETSLLEMSRTQLLERKVRELEGLLKEAEDDMSQVVERVNRSQMEVADLETERDSALVQMNKLQGQIVQERAKAEQLMK
jgi:chromosome segregation ATPase